jgi:hypothetical protein
MAAAKKGKCLGRCGASTRHTTKLKQSLFFRYLWTGFINFIFAFLFKFVEFCSKQKFKDEQFIYLFIYLFIFEKINKLASGKK